MFHSWPGTLASNGNILTVYGLLCSNMYTPTEENEETQNEEIRLPKFFETFIPTLSILKAAHKADLKADSPMRGKEIQMRVRETYFAHLPKELLQQKTSAGTNILLDRISRGLYYLKLAGYVQRVKRGYYIISPKGLKTNEIGTLTLKELKKQPEFLAHLKAKEKDGFDDTTPQERVDQGLEAIAKEVKEELLEQMKEMNPYQFETLVNDLLEAMGYGSVESTSKSNDGGIDGVVNQDKLGLEKIYVQAKRYNQGKVHETSIRDFIGAMSGDTHKGIFVTTSDFDQKAQQKAKDAHHKIILINGLQLCDLMYQYEVGVQKKKTLLIKSIDVDYWE
ncbi:MAG: restriction endonuclease [Opitutae bacterium]|nr:restriction endonuclease [Opitutae bacterium]